MRPGRVAHSSIAIYFVQLIYIAGEAVDDRRLWKHKGNSHHVFMLSIGVSRVRVTKSVKVRLHVVEAGLYRSGKRHTRDRRPFKELWCPLPSCCLVVEVEYGHALELSIMVSSGIDLLHRGCSRYFTQHTQTLYVESTPDCIIRLS
jgi:hypothetical protein